MDRKVTQAVTVFPGNRVSPVHRALPVVAKDDQVRPVRRDHAVTKDRPDRRVWTDSMVKSASVARWDRREARAYLGAPVPRVSREPRAKRENRAHSVCPVLRVRVATRVNRDRKDLVVNRVSPVLASPVRRETLEYPGK